MTDFGVTPTGFKKKLLENVIADIAARQRAKFGDSLDTETSTELGQLNGTFGSEVEELWELGEAAYGSNDPTKAADATLVALCSLTGTEKRGATPSTVPLTLNLNPGATVSAGSLVAKTGRPDIVFTLDADVTNAGGSPADIPGTATCTQDGPILAIAGTLEVIVNSVSGWNSVTNPEDTTPGRNVDTDIQLRQRREDELALRGGSTIAAIKADLLDTATHPEFEDMRQVSVLENTSDEVDANALPPHSFEVLLDDGDTPTIDDDLIAQSIFDSRPGGIPSVGTESGTATDENGDPQIEHFTRVTLRPVYVTFTLTTNGDYPVDGDDQIKALAVESGVEYEIAESVIALAVRAIALRVAGVIDVPTFAIGFAPSPGADANLSIGVRERATFSSTNIVIT